MVYLWLTMSRSGTVATPKTASQFAMGTATDPTAYGLSEGALASHHKNKTVKSPRAPSKAP